MDSLKLILSNLKYFAAAWVFASLNILTGTWVLYLPHIKQKFGINDAQIGIALFCTAVGMLLSIPLIPKLNEKFGVGNCTKFGILIFALVYNLPFLVPNYIILCIALFVIGIFSALTDISMNALVSEIEKKNEIHIMSSAHGFFSLGGFIGAGIGSLLITQMPNPLSHMLLISCLVFGINFILSSKYNHIQEQSISSDEIKKSWKNLFPLFGLSIIAFIIMLNEGAVEHWSNLFFYDIINVSESEAGLGFIAFSICMTIGRFLGDGISLRFGSIPIICAGCIIAMCGFGCILISTFWLSVMGFGIIGLGLSVIVPEIYRLAGTRKDIQASVGISVVSGVGFAGFLIGPMLLGFISNWSNLIYSFGFLTLLTFLAFLITFFRLRKWS